MLLLDTSLRWNDALLIYEFEYILMIVFFVPLNINH